MNSPNKYQQKLTWSLVTVLISFLQLGRPLFAQHEILADSIDEKSAKTFQGTIIDGYRLFICQNERKSGDENVFFYLTHPHGGYVKTSVGTESHIEIIGYTSDEQTIVLFFSGTDVKNSNLQSLTFYKNEKGRPVFSKWEDKADENQLISYLVFNNNLHRIDYDSDKQILYLYRYDNKAKVDSLAIEITDTDLLDHLKKNKSSKKFLSDKRPESHFVFIQDKLEPSMEMAARQNKIYSRDNSLWLVIDKFKREKDLASSIVYQLDFSKKAIKKNTLVLTAEANVDHNSILLGDTLYALSIGKQYMNLDCFDFRSLEKIKKITYLRSQRIDFKKSFVIEDDESIEKDMYGQEIDKQSSEATFPHMIGKGIPVIIVSSLASNYHFLIGKYELPVGNGKPGAWTPIGATAPGQAPMYVPTGGTPSRKTYFYGQLTKNLEVDKGNSEGKLEKIEQRRARLSDEIKLGGSGMFLLKDKGYLMYVDKKKKRLHVEEF